MSQALRGVILVCLTTPLLAQSTDDNFKSARARKALTQYEDGVKKLNQDYAKNLAALQKQYADELEECRKTALEAKNLNEAQRVLTALTALEEEMKEEKAGPGVLLISPKFGAADKWIDVTANLRRLMKRGPVSVTPEDLRVSDPAFGQNKSLAVAYRLQGRTHLEIFPQGSKVVIPSTREAR